jgi:uncharacterized membrane protein (DUF106 family)
MYITTLILPRLLAQVDDGSADPVWGLIGLLVLVGLIIVAVLKDTLKDRERQGEEMNNMQARINELERAKDTEKDEDESIRE